jgi:hypothetical protein
MHLLQAGVNLIYIRDLLGHADVSTTEIYARANADAKRKAIESAYQSLTPEPLPNWTAHQDLLEWLDHISSNTPDYVAGTRPNTPRPAETPVRPHNPAVHIMALKSTPIFGVNDVNERPLRATRGGVMFIASSTSSTSTR